LIALKGHLLVEERINILLKEELPNPKTLARGAHPLSTPAHFRCVGAAAGERLYVIFPVAGAGTAGPAGRRAGMLPLEFPRHFAGSVFLAEGAVEATATAIATMHETSFGAAPISTGASRSSIPPAGQDDSPGSRIVRRDAGSPSERRRTDTNSRLHAA
jgi:hypothetical protein